VVRENITPRHPNFTLEHQDLRNARTNPDAAREAPDLGLGHLSDSSDFIIAASLFTHMLKAEATVYLRLFREC
jgi:hypothetical protein